MSIFQYFHEVLRNGITLDHLGKIFFLNENNENDDGLLVSVILMVILTAALLAEEVATVVNRDTKNTL